MSDSPVKDAPALDRGLRTGRAQSEAQFRRLLESLPAAACTCDADGLITYFNARAVELWGRAPRLNDPTERLNGPDSAPAGEEIVIERADSRRITVLSQASPM